MIAVAYIQHFSSTITRLIRPGKVRKSYVLKTVRKIQEILLRLEEKQEQSRIFIIYTNEFFCAQ